MGKNIYAGTKTEKNLWEAFAGESQARNKYTYFASVAKKAGYEQAELTTVSTNTAAKSLYEKLGFVQYGVQPHSRKMKDGSYQDEIFMVKML